MSSGAAALIQLSEVVNDPDLAQSFQILRSTSTEFLNGVWQSTTTSIGSYGVIANPTDRYLDMQAEGDVIKGDKVFWSSQPIYATRATEGVGFSSDILIWRGLQFRVVDVKQFEDYGFWRATAVRMKSD